LFSAEFDLGPEETKERLLKEVALNLLR
jgi:hypothetical protein